MESLKYVMLSLCLGWLVAGVVNMLAPGGGIGRTVRLTLSVFTLAVLVIPFSQTYDISELLNFETQSLPTQTSGVSSELMEQAAKDEVEAVVSQIAENEGVSVFVEDVQTRFSDGKIWISSLTLTVEGNSRQATAVTDSIKQQMDTNVTVYRTEEDKTNGQRKNTVSF
jgi:hypothetical protein